MIELAGAAASLSPPSIFFFTLWPVRQDRVQGGFFNFALDILNGFLCFVGFYPCFFAGNILLFIPCLVPRYGCVKERCVFHCGRIQSP